MVILFHKNDIVVNNKRKFSKLKTNNIFTNYKLFIISTYYH